VQEDGTLEASHEDGEVAELENVLLLQHLVAHEQDEDHLRPKDLQAPLEIIMPRILGQPVFDLQVLKVGEIGDSVEVLF
jgi:hypothetical protein